MAANLVLAESTTARYATGAIMYFAQGIPAGLISIALPAWLASEGLGAGDIAGYLAVIALPWAFKLLSGPLMDRFEFRPMGRRRPWVLGAQLGLTLSLLGLMLVEEPAEQLGMLMLLGVLINVFAATQDVAVDGMAIDLTPVNEQGRLNAFMAFGKSIGWASSSAVSGVLLVTFGIGATGAVAAAVSLVVLVGFSLTLEREGERRLPLSRGQATPGGRPAETMRALFRGLNSVLWDRRSIVVMLIMFVDGLVHGYGHALMPIAAVKLFGFTTPEWSQQVAAMGLAGALIALGLGPLIDRFGSKRMLLLTALLVAVHAFLLAETQVLWQDTVYVRVMLSIWIMLGPVTMVCIIALAMSICDSESSATQFAIYMSVANLGSAAGSKLYGAIAEGASYHEAYLLLGSLTIAVMIVLMFHRQHRAAAQSTRRAARRYTVSMGASESGMFWSGAMRCPKCRSDMQLLEIDGIEIDRCASCHGLWFDAGEMERLRTKGHAEAIDIGDAASGASHDAIQSYRCPRCGGHMTNVADEKQQHIHYETCTTCHGSYFDAGEFADLATLSIGELFRRFTAARRG